MLFLLFQLGQDRYALEARRVVEVVPLLSLTPLPGAPSGVCGIFNYRGRAVPTVDLSQIRLARPARTCLSTRIIIVNIAADAANARLVGLVAENATRVLQKEPAEFQQPIARPEGTPFSGPVLLDPEGAIQWISEEQFLPEPVRQMLSEKTSLVIDVPD